MWYTLHTHTHPSHTPPFTPHVEVCVQPGSLEGSSYILSQGTHAQRAFPPGLQSGWRGHCGCWSQNAGGPTSPRTHMGALWSRHGGSTVVDLQARPQGKCNIFYCLYTFTVQTRQAIKPSQPFTCWIHLGKYAIIFVFLIIPRQWNATGCWDTFSRKGDIMHIQGYRQNPPNS